jgi:hypothetical protein
VYPDAIDALRLLKTEGIAPGICSNLAASYDPVLRQLLSEVNGFALSYEVGEMKPHPCGFWIRTIDCGGVGGSREWLQTYSFGVSSVARLYRWLMD